MLIPKFLHIPVYGLDLSDLSYKYLLLSEKNHNTIVSDFGEGTIPEGIITQGEIKNEDALVDILTKLARKTEMKFVAIALPDERGFLRSIKLPSEHIKKNEIENALRLQIDEHVPLPPEEIAFDYTVVKEEKDHYDLVLRAFPKSIIYQYTDVLAKVGFIPAFIEPELSTILRASVPREHQDIGMLIDWGQTRTTFAIFNNAVVGFTSTIPIGGQLLDETIARAFQVSKIEAQKLKQEFAEIPENNTSSAREKTGIGDNKQQVFQAIIPIIVSLREEAEKYIQYWQTHSEEKTIPRHIYLSGGDANLLGLPEYFTKELGIETTLANPWTNVSFPKHYLPKLSWKDSLRYISAIGLAEASSHAMKLL